MDLWLILNYVPSLWNKYHVKNVKYQINRTNSNRFDALKRRENPLKSDKNDEIENTYWKYGVTNMFIKIAFGNWKRFEKLLIIKINYIGYIFAF